MKHRILKLLGLAGLVLATSVTLAACGNSSSKQLNTKKITIGVTAGPHEQILDQVKKLAAKDGLKITVRSFTDYNTPNSALSSGDIGANSYQTGQFLTQQEHDKNYKFDKAFKTIALPMGLYSKSIKNLKDLKNGDKIAVPNDPANETRALELFQKNGVIKLRKGAGEKATKKDVVSNPKHLKIYELDASQLPKQLNDITVAAINSNFALANHIYLNTALAHEPLKHNVYANYFVVQKGHKNDKVIKQVKKYYQSKTIKNYINKEFKGAVVAQW